MIFKDFDSSTPATQKKTFNLIAIKHGKTLSQAHRTSMQLRSFNRPEKSYDFQNSLQKITFALFPHCETSFSKILTEEKKSYFPHTEFPKKPNISQIRTNSPVSASFLIFSSYFLESKKNAVIRSALSEVQHIGTCTKQKPDAYQQPFSINGR